MFNRKIIAVQSNWGGEYECLNSFFRTLGIIHLVSCPHAHQQNDAAERKHRHIVEMGLTLLAHATMPLKYWDQTFLTTTHLFNRTPTKILDYDTTIHRLLGATPDYTNMCTFGCVCWPNFRPYNRHKLQFRSICCAFLGYSNIHKGYKCLDISSGRMYISRDVIFDENIFPFAQLSSYVGAQYSADVLLLPPSSLASSDTNVNNILPLSDSPPCFLPFNVLQPWTIPVPGSSAAIGTEVEDDPPAGSTPLSPGTNNQADSVSITPPNPRAAPDSTHVAQRWLLRNLALQRSLCHPSMHPLHPRHHLWPQCLEKILHTPTFSLVFVH
jgi:hypothetical protein